MSKMDINEIRQNVADNVIRLRTSNGMTQAQLAEKLDYSDKAVSKWERGESVPDVFVLKQIADLFGVTVDDLIRKPGEISPVNEKEVQRVKKHNKLQITLLTTVGVWLLVTAVFIVLQAAGVPFAWLAFIWGVPATAVDLLVFNAIWGKYKNNFIFISLIIWTVPAAIFVTFAVLTGSGNMWYIFLLGIPLQIATIFWSQIKSVVAPKKK